MTFIITEPCMDMKDRSCTEVCPVDCIHEHDDWETLLIDPSVCIDCELCVRVCPVQAIYAENAVPRRWHEWIARNYEAFGLDAP